MLALSTLIFSSGCASKPERLAEATVAEESAALAERVIAEGVAIRLPDMPAECSQKVRVRISAGERLDVVALRLKREGVDVLNARLIRCHRWYRQVQQAFGKVVTDD